MQKILEFVQHHWLLWLFFAVCLVAIVIYELMRNMGGATKLNPQAAISFINEKDATIIDLRDASAYSKGHVINAISMPLKELDKHMAKLTKMKTKPILLYCDNGQQSNGIGAKLRKQEFTDVCIIAGGIHSWQRDKFPLAIGSKTSKKTGN